MPDSTTSSGSVGRPAGQDSDKVRASLLSAARDHFLKRDFKAVSLREIASSAGVNGAMVNYYFGGKKGLYMTMVDELFESLNLQMRELNESDGYTIADFSRNYTQLIVENPWWPNFFVREILFGDGETKEEVVRRISTIIAPDLMKSLAQEIDSGHYRKDLKPELTLLSLLAMTVFPFLAAPMVEKAFGLTIDAETAPVIAEHNIDLFLNGVLAKSERLERGSPS